MCVCVCVLSRFSGCYQQQQKKGSMNHCTDCKYWEKGVCARPNWLERNEKAQINGMGVFLTAYDDQGVGFVFRTGPRFGCVQFKSRKMQHAENGHRV